MVKWLSCRVLVKICRGVLDGKSYGRLFRHHLGRLWLGNGRGVSEKMRNDGFGIYLGRVLCLKRLTGAMPVPATHHF